MSTPAQTITERIRARLGTARGATMPTLDELKDMLGIPPGDTSQDDEILDGFAATIAIVEAYLGRGIAFASVVQDFEPIDSRNPKLLLYRFPVATVRSVSVDGAAFTGWRVLNKSGILEWRDGCMWLGRDACRQRGPVVSVDYDGGYADDEWPVDLMDALLRAFFARWHATGDTGNTADITTGPPIEAMSVDGSSVTFGAAGVNAAEFGKAEWPPELQSVVAILEPYRARVVSGV
jgi:hypothetical protein